MHPHNTTKKPGSSIRCEVQGSLFKLHTPGPKPKACKRKGDRIKTFTRASRKRMLEKAARLSLTPGLTDFLTLTYPGAIDPVAGGPLEGFDPKEAKKHLFKFWKILRYHYPGISAFYRMEAQERGAVHFHLLIWNAPYIPQGQIQDWWQKARGSTLSSWVWITAILSMREALGYISKYMSKPEQLLGEAASPAAQAEGVGGEAASLLENSVKLEKIKEAWSKPGRFWGVLDSRYLPYAQDATSLSLPSGGWQKAMIRSVRQFRKREEERRVKERNEREMKKAAGRKSHRLRHWWVFNKEKFKKSIAYLRPDRGFTVFTDKPYQWLELAAWYATEEMKHPRVQFHPLNWPIEKRISQEKEYTRAGLVGGYEQETDGGHIEQLVASGMDQMSAYIITQLHNRGVWA